MRPSEAYIDALYDVVEEWCRKHLPPGKAERFFEEGQQGELVQRIIEMTAIELALRLQQSMQRP